MSGIYIIRLPVQFSSLPLSLFHPIVRKFPGGLSYLRLAEACAGAGKRLEEPQVERSEIMYMESR
jgi:hypothetical protein